ncbi:MAG: histidine kinase [Eubacteriales bacterium]|nr:histidine kinase [Eubacteriales bacterium]
MIIDVIALSIVLILLLTGRKCLSDGSLQARLIRMLMICCLSVLVIDIPGLKLDGYTFALARPLLWLVDMAYWVAHILYFWLWVIFSDLWIFRSENGAKRRAGLYAIPMIIQLGLVLTTPWTGWLFTINEQNQYMTGTAYQLCLAPHYAYLVIALLLVLIGCLSTCDSDIRHRCLSVLAYMLLPFLGAAMEIVAYGVPWVWPMVALSLLMVYLGLQQQMISDKQLAIARAAEKAAHMDAEMAMSRMSIMLSQIQPHFLYNTLCVIQDLCHDRAPEAEQATIAFSRFLRGNLDSLKSDKLIPFEQELKHSQYYLTLEQMRFGRRLAVEYDLQTTLFRLPALTLQPLVENAVRYGIMKKESGGTVRISSAETEGGFVVTVEDNGVGFDPYQPHEDGRTHIGIDNVRQRMRAMCAGDLAIVSHPGEGTVATLTLPKGGKCDENTGA